MVVLREDNGASTDAVLVSLTKPAFERYIWEWIATDYVNTERSYLEPLSMLVDWLAKRNIIAHKPEYCALDDYLLNSCSRCGRELSMDGFGELCDRCADREVDDTAF